MDRTEQGWVQADRGGRPLQAVFLPGEERDAYLSGEPANDDRFVHVFAHELDTRAAIPLRTLCARLESCCRTFFSTTPAARQTLPQNGRVLTDDVVDVFFSMLTNGKVTGDKVALYQPK